MNEDKKTSQQWEMLASPGHVLLARVNSYRLKTKLPLLLAAGAVLLVYFAFLATPYIANSAGSVTGWIVGKTSSIISSKPIEMTPAPLVKPFGPILKNVNFDGKTIPRLAEDVAPEMQAQVIGMQAGKKMEDCNFSTRITDDWFDGIDVGPKCRYSKDLTRLWVWAFVNNNGRYQPWAGLVIKMDGKVAFVNVEARGLAKIQDVKSVNPEHIPRTIAQDFPELLIEGQK